MPLFFHSVSDAATACHEAAQSASFVQTVRLSCKQMSSCEDAVALCVQLSPR